MKKTVSTLGLDKCIALVKEVFDNHDVKFVDWVIDCDKRRNGLTYKDIYREVVFTNFDYKKGCQGAHKVLDAVIKEAYSRKRIEEAKKPNTIEITLEEYDGLKAKVQQTHNSRQDLIYAVSKLIYGKVDYETYEEIIHLMNNKF